VYPVPGTDPIEVRSPEDRTSYKVVPATANKDPANSNNPRTGPTESIVLKALRPGVLKRVYFDFDPLGAFSK
jgi:hypothetical protein